ncbi:MAG: hypothetical protein PHX38_01640 [Sulfuricella sp.]|nr:hypothetical protein [Sulfuricella sp.]
MIFQALCATLNSVTTLLTASISAVLLMLALIFAAPLRADVFRPDTLELSDGVSVPLRIFPAHGKTLLLWLACDEGHGAWEPKAAQALAAGGTEAWLTDLLSAHFVPAAPSAIKQLPAADVVALIERARSATSKNIVLVAAGPAAVPAVRGALEWQRRHPRDPALAGAILLYPELYAVTPAPGVEAAYYPEVARTAVPVFIYHSQRSPGRWWLEHLKVEFRKGGSRVDSQVLPGVRGYFYGRDDSTPEEDAMAARLPELLGDALKTLLEKR